MLRSSLALPLAACLAALPLLPLAAALAAPAVDARYAVQTMGVDLGRAALRLERTGAELSTTFRFETDALLGFVEASDTRMESTAAAARDAAVSPRRFAGVYQKDDRVREVGMAYGPDGGIDGFTFAKRGKVRVDRVPQGLGAGAVDPLAAFLRARAWIAQAAEGEELAVAVFDGRKRYEATMRYLGLTQLASDEGSTAAHSVSVRYRLLEAMNEDTGVLEPERGDRARELALSVSADGRFVPLRLEGSLDGLPVAAVLSADCAAPGGCPD
jgi:hypothetical protein